MFQSLKISKPSIEYDNFLIEKKCHSSLYAGNSDLLQFYPVSHVMDTRENILYKAKYTVPNIISGQSLSNNKAKIMFSCC